jgi:hypothetical protein
VGPHDWILVTLKRDSNKRTHTCTPCLLLCDICVRPWVQTPVPQNKTKNPKLIK